MPECPCVAFVFSLEKWCWGVGEVCPIRGIWQCLETSSCHTAEGHHWHLLVRTRAAAKHPPIDSMQPTHKHKSYMAYPTTGEPLDELQFTSQVHSSRLCYLLPPPEKPCHTFLGHTCLSTRWINQTESLIWLCALLLEWEFPSAEVAFDSFFILSSWHSNVLKGRRLQLQTSQRISKQTAQLSNTPKSRLQLVSSKKWTYTLCSKFPKLVFIVTV